MTPAAATTTTTTVLPTTTTTLPTALAEAIDGLRIAWIRTDHGRDLVLTPLAGDASIEVPLDRTAGVALVTDDGEGGLVAVLVRSSPARAVAEILRLRTGSTIAESTEVLIVDGTELYGGHALTPATLDGERGISYLRRVGGPTSQASRRTIEWTTTLVFHPFDGEPVELAVLPSSMVWDDERYDLEIAADLVDATVGGDHTLLTIMRPSASWEETGRLCYHVELRRYPEADLLELPIDFGDPDEVGCPAFPSMPRLSADGTILLGLVDTFTSQPSLVAWDVTSGKELVRISTEITNEYVGHLVGTFSDDTTGVFLRTTGGPLVRFTALDALSAAVGEVELSIPEMSDWWGPLGVISGSVDIAGDATLVSPELWRCSATDARALQTQVGLPPAVAATRFAIAAAVASCDLYALADIAADDLTFTIRAPDCPDGSTVTISEREPGWDPIDYWYRGDVAVDELTTMLDVLRRPYEFDGDAYRWADEDGYAIEIDGDGAWTVNDRTWVEECSGA